MTQHHNAKFAFFYMLSLVALVFVAISTGMIVFQLINKLIPDVINYSGYYSSESLKFAISAMIIAVPIYYLTMRQINKNLKAGHMELHSGIRRWLIYLILFVVSVVVIGWLIATINTFLNGDITLKFILKFLTVLAISAVIFNYYLYDIKRDKIVEKDRAVSLYFYGSLIIVIVSFISALMIVETPMEARNRKHDDMIVNDFNQVSSSINEYYNVNKILPDNLDVLVSNKYYLNEDALANQVNNEVYVYEILGENDYKLCATFLMSTINDNDDLDRRYRYDGHWSHEAGYQCLEQTVVDYSKTEPMIKEYFVD